MNLFLLLGFLLLYCREYRVQNTNSYLKRVVDIFYLGLLLLIKENLYYLFIKIKN